MSQNPVRSDSYRFSPRTIGAQRSGGPAPEFPFEVQQRLSRATSAADLFTAAAALISRLPGTLGVWTYGRGEAGEIALVHSWAMPGVDVAPIPNAVITSLIHQRWIQAHRPGNASVDFVAPFAPTDFRDRLVAPMLLGEELIGAIVVERREGHIYPYAPEDRAALASIVTSVALCLQTLALRHRVAELDQPAQEEVIARSVRRRVGHELHDGILQDLAYIQMQLELMGRQIRPDPEVAESLAQTLYGQLARSITELRHTIGDLRRPQPQQRGITGQLRDLASGLASEQPELQLDLAELSGVRLAPEIERAVVGIVREALQNIRKHASASSVHVDVQREDDDLYVVVADDGVGIPSSSPLLPDEHFGMEQMRELAEDMGGSLQIESSPGAGTRVRARIPLNPEH